LRATADALHGGPLENGFWSHHDLAEMAEVQRAALVEIRDLVKACYYEDRSRQVDPTTLAFTMGKIWGAVDKALET
jgi:hypothetical protein